MRARLHIIGARLFPRGPVDVARQVLLLVVAYYGYRLVRGSVDDPMGTAAAFRNAREVIHVEQTLGVFAEPGVHAWASARPAVIDVSTWFYINAHLTVTIGALAYLYVAHNRSFYFVRNMFAVAMGLALLGYALLPTAPPRLLPEWGFGDPVTETVGVTRDGPISALVNPYAALPSMHVAFALMIAMPIARLARHRVTRVACWLYPVVVTFVIVATANHFFADAVLGAATAALAASAATWMAHARPAAWAFQPAKATA